MKKKYSNSKELLELYCDNNSPLIINNKVYATNKYMLIVMDNDNYDYEIAIDNNILHIYPFDKVYDKIISLDELHNFISEVPLVDDYHSIECEECEGSGVVYYKTKKYIEKEIDCPVCKGIGNHTYKRKEKVIDKNYYIDLSISKIKIEYIQILIKTLELLEKTQIHIVKCESGFTFFTIDDIQIVCVSKSYNTCKYCDASVKREGDSFHVWDIEYECGYHIYGGFDSLSILEDEKCGYNE